MTKRLISLALAVCGLFLYGCSEKVDTEIKSQMESAVESVNSETLLECDYMLEITFGGGNVLYYAKGNASWDRENIKTSTIFDQTYMGSSVKMENYFTDGKMYSLENGNPLEIERDGAVMLSKFPYFQIPSCSGENPITTTTNSSGVAYKFVAEDTKSLCELVVGGDIYAFATVIKKPQPEKTEYGEAQCTYTVKDGRVVSARFEFDIKLFDTPASSANYTPPESEYTLDLHVVAKLEYKDFGDGVAILDYIPQNESSEDSSAG